MSGFSWALYASLQKQLSKKYKPQHLNLAVFLVSALSFSLFVDLGDLADIPSATWAILVILGIFTVASYGALAEAIKHAPAAFVSVIIVLNPLVTLSLVWAFTTLGASWIEPEVLSWFGVFGACIAILGVSLVVASPRLS